jgi:hypothetical protein
MYMIPAAWAQYNRQGRVSIDKVSLHNDGDNPWGVG